MKGILLFAGIGREPARRAAPGPFYFLIVIVLQVLFGILATLITMAFSRCREFRADAGGAQPAGRERMIGALRALERARASLPGQLHHPPLEERIAALQALRANG